VAILTGYLHWAILTGQFCGGAILTGYFVLGYFDEVPSSWHN